jgi:hypothetical protein
MTTLAYRAFATCRAELVETARETTPKHRRVGQPRFLTLKSPDGLLESVALPLPALGIRTAGRRFHS